MKATGIVRRIDQLGRVVLPKELRDSMDIGEYGPLEIYVEGDNIVLRKYQPGCALCGSMDNLVQHSSGKKVCQKCLQG